MTQLTIDGILLSDLTELICRSSEKGETKLYIAHKIKSSDPTEQYFHVEFPNPDNCLKHPEVWRIQDWKTSYTRFTRRKELSELERKAMLSAGEVIGKIIKVLQAKTQGMPENNARDIAVSFVASRNNVVISKVFGINIADLIAAQDGLSNYKKMHNMK